MSDRHPSHAAPNSLKRSLQNSSNSGQASNSNLPKRVKEEPSSPPPMSDSDSDFGMDLDTPPDHILQIYQTMLPNNPGAVNFLFSPAFTTPLESLTRALGSEYRVCGKVVLEEFRRLLAIKLFTVDEDATKISPTPLMDRVWHAAILDTRFYATIQAGLGLTIHHRPLPTNLNSNNHNEDEEADNDEEDEEEEAVENQARDRRLAIMTSIYKAYFTTSPLLPRINPRPIGTPINLPQGTGMQLFIKGARGNVHTLNVLSTSLIEDIKATMEEKDDVPREDQRLMWNGKQLEDGRTLAFYKIGRDHFVHLVMAMRGC